MGPKPRAVVSWSGGKDCCLALHRARAAFEIVGLVSMLTQDGTRSRSHGLRPAVLQRQADALGLPLLTACAEWDDYDTQFGRLLTGAKQWDISYVVFGDVFPDAHRQWAETVAQSAGLVATEPLWAESTRALAAEFVAAGGRAIVMTVREDRLDRDWLGRPLTLAALNELDRAGVDPGGEHGEFHTVVTWFPGFGAEISLKTVESLSHGGCAFLDVIPAFAPRPLLC